MKTHTMGGITEAVKYAQIHGGRIATHRNTHECTWFPPSTTPTDILNVAEYLCIDTFGTWESFSNS